MSAHNLPWRVSSGQAIDCHGNIVLTRHSWRALNDDDVQKGDNVISPTQADDNLKAIVQAINTQ